MTSSNNDKELENPVIFWSSIGVAISASFATTMKFNILTLILTVIAGLFIGMTVGYFSNTESETSIAKEELALKQNFEPWWQQLTKPEKSAVAILGFIFMLIMLYVSGSIIGQAIFG
jgi:membrane protein DedA with SNARE-associated domain|tara:strand:- start:247 stop:597 length:351 start_codon:yes stop_codon:yes gene_type:complete